MIPDQIRTVLVDNKESHKESKREQAPCSGCVLTFSYWSNELIEWKKKDGGSWSRC
uniref:CYP73A43/C4H1 n=1 Tax=Arundo donax TaxID=35708 RepID=A0A0A9G9N0_ARUDO